MVRLWIWIIQTPESMELLHFGSDCKSQYARFDLNIETLIRPSIVLGKIQGVQLTAGFLEYTLISNLGAHTWYYGYET